MDSTTLFLSGDVMLGRAIDQVLPHPGSPRIYEAWAKSALDYVALAERANGPIPRPVGFSYPWGEALAVLEDRAPDVRIVNLETAVTARGAPWSGKGIHYRMHPMNLACVAAAGIDCCVLANNHTMDWGREGLLETLSALRRAGLAASGAGRNRDEAEQPAVLPLPGGRRVLVFACGHASSGIPEDWAARGDRPGIALLPELSAAAAEAIGRTAHRQRRPGDLVVASIHWGGNWGYPVPPRHREFARRLVETGAIDIVHGHSSHLPLGIEVHRGKPILYGCGDLLNDYEGIPGHEAFRPDLGLLYFATFEPPGGTLSLSRLELVPVRIVRFRLQSPTEADRRWLAERMARECAPLGTRIGRSGGGGFFLDWGR